VVGIIETSAALGARLLVLTIAVVLDRRPYRPGSETTSPEWLHWLRARRSSTIAGATSLASMRSSGS
jgi:hypothetical protein